MINAKAFLGRSVNFQNLCRIYPPKVNDIVDDESFFTKLQCFIISQEDIEDQYVEQDLSLEEMPTPFEEILNLAYNDPQMNNLICQAFFQFTHEEVTFFYKLKRIAFGNKEELITNYTSVENIRFLTEENYFDFQNSIREFVGIPKVQPYNADENPKIKKMKAKARYRDRVKAQKGMGLSLGATLSSICCMGIGITPLNIGELSYVAITELMQRYSNKEKFEIDLNTIWAGADQKKHKITPKHWIRDLDKD